MIFTTLEHATPIEEAVRRLARLFAGRRARAGAPLLGTLWYQKSVSLWCYVDPAKEWAGTGSRHYWIGYGRDGRSWERRILQTDVPESGLNRHYAACFATDSAGNTWLMHDGRITVAGRHLEKTQLAAFLDRARVEVTVSKGKPALYYPVTNIDAADDEALASIDGFVSACEAARKDLLGSHPETIPPDADPKKGTPDGPERRGPEPHDWTGSREPTRFEASRPAYCYVLRFGDTRTWKIGWTVRPARRLATINAHIPVSMKPRWAIHEAVLFPTARLAYKTEQWALYSKLGDCKPRREQVVCDPDRISQVLERIRAEAAAATCGVKV